MTEFAVPTATPSRRPGLAVAFALLPLPVNLLLNTVLAGITTDPGVSLALTIGQLLLALALETTAVVLAIRVLNERRRLGARTSGTAIVAIVLAVIIAFFMVASTVLFYVLAASGIYM